MPGDPTDKTRNGNIPADAITNDGVRDTQSAWQSHADDANINTDITATRECRSVGG